ncbi:hypothetical protein EBL87_09145 [Cereibacter sphaeroides]|uniref:hypothetical protein n=1 Tax=Cereibacter sphaeroides TaxID=1063 RepID=UPI000F522125|nr:hypothetical protein [Cereibacter sphaeroides]AZB63894.1 hypothetical protein EBL87_09145 [Cereibacter sphaeroides]AZB68184.1 hypothetical protein EBL86_07325 [Cereibacter sphaeroides]
MIDLDQTEAFLDDTIRTAWDEEVAAASPLLPGGIPSAVDRIGIARRVAQRLAAQRLGCTAQRVLDLMSAQS